MVRRTGAGYVPSMARVKLDLKTRDQFAALSLHEKNDYLQEVARRVTAARGEARLRVLPGVDHFAVIDPAHAAWLAVREEVEGLL